MGTPKVKVRVTNPADPEMYWEGQFLVDSGATDTLVPRLNLEAIGLKPEAHASTRWRTEAKSRWTSPWPCLN